MNDSDHTQMIAAIQRRMQERDMRPTDLAQATGTTDATISRFLNRKTRPRPQLLESIVRELGLDMAYIFRLAGLPLPARPGPLDPSAAYLAQRISELPPHLREKALDAAGAVVDAFSELAEPFEELFEGEDATSAALLAELARRDPAAYEQVRQILQQPEPTGAPANHGGPTLTQA